MAATRGSEFGVIAIRDIGPRPCELNGYVQITGADGAGRAVTNTARSPLPGTLTLSPDARTPPEVTPPADIILSPPPPLDGAIWLAEDHPGSALCRPGSDTPPDWHVILPGGLTFTVANADPAGPAHLAPSGGLVLCAGQLTGTPALVYFGQPVS